MLDSVLSILASLSKWGVGLFTSKNAADMKANAAAKTTSTVTDQVTTDVAKQDTTAIEKDIS